GRRAEALQLSEPRGREPRAEAARDRSYDGAARDKVEPVLVERCTVRPTGCLDVDRRGQASAGKAGYWTVGAVQVRRREGLEAGGRRPRHEHGIAFRLAVRARISRIVGGIEADHPAIAGIPGEQRAVRARDLRRRTELETALRRNRTRIRARLETQRIEGDER